jgi:deazaflavin-dependent oxidoreductase (nitroreductase family)
MSTALLVVGALFGFVAAAGLVFVVGMRLRSRVVINAVRRVARTTKRLPLTSAGHGSAYASVVVHTGRRSGRRYRTPVRAVTTDDGFVVALPYGSNSDWVRNVLRRGGATMMYHGRVYELDQPRLVQLHDMETWFTHRDQRAHQLFRLTEALVAHRAPREGVAAELGATATVLYAG